MLQKLTIAICIAVLTLSTAVAMTAEYAKFEPCSKAQAFDTANVISNTADELHQVTNEMSIGGRQKP